MTAPRVSVIMPVLNGERYLDEAVQSLLAQTFTDFEGIVLDDGSTDSTWDRLTAYAARDSRLRLARNPETLGVRRALNKGLGLAQGEYLARQDADDRSAPERFAAQVAFLDSHPEVGLLGTLVNVMDAEGQPLAVPAFSEAVDDESLRALLLETCPFCHGSVMLRRSALDLAGFYDESMEEAEDYELWLRLAEVTRLANLPDRLYHFRYYADSVSSRRHPKVMWFMALALERAAGRRPGPAPAEMQAAIARAYVRAALSSHAHGDAAGAGARLERALARQPSVLYNETALAELFAPHTSRVPPEAGAAFIESAFAQVFGWSRPQPHLAAIKARLLSRLHMREAFAGAQAGDWARVQAHLGPGVRLDPTWLANRGVLSLLVKTRLRRSL